MEILPVEQEKLKKTVLTLNDCLEDNGMEFLKSMMRS